MKYLLILLLVGVLFHSSKAQVNTSKKYNITRKGAMFGYWGWNRAFYSASNVHFTGANYDFTVHNMIAHDRQTPFALDPYFNPLRITIPQTNLQIGYFIKDNLALVFSIDHMKYVMDQEQVAKVTGTIGDAYYASMVQNGFVNMSDEKFLTFEHTDGLNYFNLGVEHYQSIYSNDWFNINWSYGAGVGGLLPKSNVKLFGNDRSDRFHLAGFGLDVRSSLNFVFFKHIALRTEIKEGYINMPNIKTTLNNKPDNASQQFFFGQFNLGIAYFFQTKKEK